jgi:hypothetical protein
MSVRVLATSAPLRSMRIIAIPLTRPRRTITPKGEPEHKEQSDTALTYYHFQISPKASAKGGLVNWVSGKAASMWAGFGTAPEGSWKVRYFTFHEPMVRVIMHSKPAQGLPIRRAARGPDRLRGARAQGGGPIPRALHLAPFNSKSRTQVNKRETGK